MDLQIPYQLSSKKLTMFMIYEQFNNMNATVVKMKIRNCRHSENVAVGRKGKNGSGKFGQ